jgi:Na+-transporting methylmalonyl-CoA/oxaloacetate decarboxylase gamma subunit
MFNLSGGELISGIGLTSIGVAFILIVLALVFASLMSAASKDLDVVKANDKALNDKLTDLTDKFKTKFSIV